VGDECARRRSQDAAKRLVVTAFCSIAPRLDNLPFTMTTISAAQVLPGKRPYTFAA